MRRRAIILAVGLAAGVACVSEPEAGVVQAGRVQVARPAGCVDLALDEGLARRMQAARAGEVLCLAPGRWVGQLDVPAGVTVWGPPETTIVSVGQGTTVRLAAGAQLYGLTVDGSGGRFDVLDAAIHLEGEGGVVEGVLVRHAFFGILAERARRVRIRGNHVAGLGGESLGLRGDGIRLWETHDSLVEANLVEDARDCVVWYSRHNRVVGNAIHRGRYGTHFMYSHDNEVSGNLYSANEVGIFAMYSRSLSIHHNALLHSGGAAGMGLGLKESGDLHVHHNLIARNTLGLFLDSSPLEPGDTITVEDNMVQLSDVGVAFLSSQSRVTFRGNTFRDNRTPVRVEGGGDALGLTWDHNDWDDYAGYDLDHDGVGDVPYELRDLADGLVARSTDLTFFTGTPALALVSLAGHVAPLMAPKPVLIDARPRLEARHAPEHLGRP